MKHTSHSLIIQTITRAEDQLACAQALCLRKGWKTREEREGKREEPVYKHLRPLFCPLDVIAKHLSSRSLSVSWIHWNVINFACKKGVGGNTWLLPHVKMLLFPVSFFLWWVDYALEGLSLNWAKVILPFISYWEVMTCILFSAVVFSGQCDLPSDARTLIFIWALLKCKALHCS